MSASTAIGLVGRSLRSLLLGEMQLTPQVPVTILAPDEKGGDQRLNLFLYKAEENQFLRNAEPRVNPANPGQLVPPPLSLNLFYLMTPYALNDDQTGNTTAHEILGEAMRALYENPVIPDKYLDPGLKDASEELRIIHNSFDPEELSRLWTTFTQPFRLSVMYQVSVVQLDMLPARQQPLPKRVRTTGVSVRGANQPPVVDTLAPTGGPAGSAVTLSGRYLAGWQATVTLLRTVLADGQPLTSDSFAVTIPAELPPGFYEIQVDVGRLFRRVFLFEVTA